MLFRWAEAVMRCTSFAGECSLIVTGEQGIFQDTMLQAHECRVPQRVVADRRIRQPDDTYGTIRRGSAPPSMVP